MDADKIGSLLALVYLKRAELILEQTVYTTSMENREKALLPQGGWKGGNADDRKANKIETLNADEPWKTASDGKTSLDAELILCNAEIEALEALRRSHEWSIRQAIVSLPRTKNKNYNHADLSVEDAILEDETLREMDDQIFGEQGFLDEEVETKIMKVAERVLGFVDEVTPEAEPESGFAVVEDGRICDYCQLPMGEEKGSFHNECMPF